VGAALAAGGGGRRGAAGAQGRAVRGLARRAEAVRLHARRVRAAVAGGGVAGEPAVVVVVVALGHAARAAAAGPATLVQRVHGVQLQGVADVGLAVLLLVWSAGKETRGERRVRQRL